MVDIGNPRGPGREQRGRGRGRDGSRGGREREREEGDDLIDKLVHINRVAKVVKGGRRFSFAALVVVGDGRGRVGYGTGKAREVPEAIRKATDQAKRDMIRVPLREGRTLHHDINGRYGAGKVVLRSARPVPVHICHHGRRSIRGTTQALNEPDSARFEAKTTCPDEKGLDEI